MKEKEFTELNDQEQLEKRKKAKSASITNAVFIGVMIGIIIYSVLKNSIGLVTLIPLFFIFKALNNSKNKKS